MDSEAAVVSITCVLFSADTKSAAPFRAYSSYILFDLRMNWSKIISRLLFTHQWKGDKQEFESQRGTRFIVLKILLFHFVAQVMSPN